MFKYITALFVTLFASTATAQFQPAAGKLFVDYPELAQEYTPGSEFVIYAIVPDNSARVNYVITRYWRGRSLSFGSFECGSEFTYMDSFTNGFRDIFCVTTDGLDNKIPSVLRVQNSAGYEQYFQ